MTRAKTLRFHAATFELIGKKPGGSRRALDLLKQRERQCGIGFPAAVREWYLAGGPGLGMDIGCGETADEMVALRELGKPLANWYAMGTADLVAAGLLVVMHENQGVCTWTVKLDGSDDPPVVVEVDSSAKAASLSRIRWQRCAESFSTFMYCRAWDHGHALDRISFGLFAQDRALARRDVAFLRAHFTEGPTTFGHPGVVNYRFFTEDSAILIWAGKGQSDWHLMAASEEALLRLLRQVSRCGTLTETLYALADPRSEVVLGRSRAEWARAPAQRAARGAQARRRRPR
jgi:hypothetical protein